MLTILSDTIWPMETVVIMRWSAVRVMWVMPFVMVDHWDGSIGSHMKASLMNSLLVCHSSNLKNPEVNRMKHNAFKVCDEVTDRVNGAPAPGGFMKSYTSDPLEEMFFSDEPYVKLKLERSTLNL